MVAEKNSDILNPATLSQVTDLPLLARLAVEGFLAGRHRSVNRGYGGEFMQYRPYVPGDDTKYVDWKLYARQDKVCMKVYQEETDMRIALVVDATASMGYCGEGAPCSKYRYAAMAAACLAYLAHHQGDAVGIFVYDGAGVTRRLSSESGGSMSRMALDLARREPMGTRRLAEVTPMVEDYIGGHGMAVVMSDFYGESETMGGMLKRLRYGRSDCVLFQILDRDELRLPFGEGVSFVDSETGAEIATSAPVIREEYQEKLEKFTHGFAENALQSSMDYVRMVTDQSLGDVLAEYLSRRMH